MNDATALPIGTPLIYFNQWTNFETNAFQGQFSALTSQDIKNMRAGDIVYLDVDPLHPHGKVYGRVKVAITQVIPLDNGEFRFHYEGGNRIRGFGTTERGECRKLEKAVSEEALAAIVKRLPLATKISRFD